MIEMAKDVLLKQNYSLVLVKESEVICTSQEKGVKALLGLLKNSPSLLEGATVADQVSGKAAAMLCVAGDVKEVYSHLISEPALVVFEKAGIPVTYGQRTDLILNRDRTGLCPMENIAQGTDNVEELISGIEAFFEKVNQSKEVK